MSDLKLCLGCMNPLSGERVCPHCGYDRESTSLANYLTPGTMLHERFLVGKALDANGEGVTYIGYDTAVGCKILIREYFPEQLCSRVPNSTEINVNYEHLAQYKALMAEYTELNKALARLRNLSHLTPAIDLFAENNTTYAVYEYLEGQTLLDYLKENAGELSWNIVRRIFPPLFTTLSLLHNAGVLHRGLSPETIFVTDKGELKLRGFCISAVRTNDTELDAELFDGYAAPEQYFADRQQGTWTDVYGICAVLYRILTGTRAADAISRQDYDNLIPPTELNSHIPENVSKGIMQGLALEGSDRVRNITDLVTLLFDKTSTEEQETHRSPKEGTTAVYPAQDVKRVSTAAAAAIPAAARPRLAGSASRSGSAARSAAESRQHPQRSYASAPRSNAAARPAERGFRDPFASVRDQQAARGNNGRTPAPRSGSRPAPQRQRPAAPNTGRQQHMPMQQNGRAAMNRSAAAQNYQSAARTRSQQQNYAAARRRPASASNSRSRSAQDASVFEKIRAPLFIAFLFIAIVTVVIFAFAKIIGSNQNEHTLSGHDSGTSQTNVIPAQTNVSGSGAHPDAVAPKLIGQLYSIQSTEMSNNGWLYLEPIYEFSEIYKKDQIMWQEFEPGTEFFSGSTMKVKVSLGSSLVSIPPFKGMQLKAYLDKLSELGFVKPIDGDNGTPAEPATTTAKNKNKKQKTTTTTVAATTTVTANAQGKRQVVMYRAKVDYNYSNGYVCGVSPAAGKIVDALEDYQIIVYYAYNPVFTTIGNGTKATGSGTKSTKTTATTATSVSKVTKSTEKPPQPVTQAPPASETQPPAPPPTPPASQQTPEDNQTG